jgi:hypothetical protein
MRQGHIGDGRVQNFRDGRQRHGYGDNPGVMFWLVPCGCVHIQYFLVIEILVQDRLVLYKYLGSRIGKKDSGKLNWKHDEDSGEGSSKQQSSARKIPIRLAP